MLIASFRRDGQCHAAVIPCHGVLEHDNVRGRRSVPHGALVLLRCMAHAWDETKHAMKPTQVIQLLVLGVLWGSSYLFIKVAVDGVDPATLVAGRLAIGSLFLVSMMRLNGLWFSRDRAFW